MVVDVFLKKVGGLTLAFWSSDSGFSLRLAFSGKKFVGKDAAWRSETES